MEAEVTPSRRALGTSHRIHNDGAETLHIAWGFNRSDLTEAGIVWDE